MYSFCAYHLSHRNFSRQNKYTNNPYVIQMVQSKYFYLAQLRNYGFGIQQKFSKNQLGKKCLFCQGSPDIFMVANVVSYFIPLRQLLSDIIILDTKFVLTKFIFICGKIIYIPTTCLPLYTPAKLRRSIFVVYVSLILHVKHLICSLCIAYFNNLMKQ